MTRRKTNISGFTLVETSIASVLLLAIGAGILGLQVVIGNLQLKTFSSFTNVESGIGAVRQMVQELRTARAGDNGAFLIESALGSSITFYSDIDADGLVEKVTYTQSGTNITKSVINPTGYPVTYPPNAATTITIVDSLRNGSTPLFTYYNEDWPEDTTNNPLPTPANLTQIKLVRVYMRLNSLANDTLNDYVIDSSAQIRMVKTNL